MLAGSRIRVQFAFAFTLAVVPLSAQAERGSGYLGIGFSVDSGSGGLTVEQVVQGSPASHAEIHAGDELVRMGETEMRFPSHRAALDFLVRKATAGAPILVTVRSGGRLLEVEVVPTSRPAGLADRNERALRCADGESEPGEAWSRVFGSVP